MKLYHGTTEPDLTVLAANSKDREGNPALYLTNNYAYSLFYIRDRKIDFVTCGIHSDGKVYYDEKLPNQLKLLYQGKQGYVYETDTAAQSTKVKGIFVAGSNTEVTDKQFIPDAYQAIQEEIKQGNVIFIPYESLTPEQKATNQEGILWELQTGRALSSAKKAFYREHFPEVFEKLGNKIK